MRKVFALLAGALLVFALSSGSWAQTVSVDLSKVDSGLAAKILQAQKKAEPPKPTITVENAERLANVGENIAKAIAATAKALSVEVNEFVKTPVGVVTMALLVWHFVGGSLWATFGGCAIWLILGLVIWRSYSIFHIPHKQLVRENGAEKTYEYVSYDFKDETAKVTSWWVHFIVFVVLSITMLAIVF